MIPTLRLLLLLLLGAVPIAAASLQPMLLWVAGIYFAGVLALVIADVFITTRPHHIEAERLHDDRLSIGADNMMTVLLSNASGRAVTFTLRDEYPYQFHADATYLTGTLPPFDIYEARYHVRPVRRGDYQFGDINLRYSSHFKTFIRQARYPAAATVPVYPNILDVRKYDLLARKGLLQELGLRQTRQYGEGSEFERLRDYTPDDEFRRINWKATARRSRPIAVEYQTERSQYVMSVLDTGRLMRPPVGELAKLDYVINTTLLLSYVALLKGDHVGMLTFSDEVHSYLAPRSKRDQFYRMLETLYNTDMHAVESDYPRALGMLSRKQGRRSLILVFTDLVTLDAASPLIASLRRLARRHLPLIVTISDPDVHRIAHQPVAGSEHLYQRAVAEMLLDERRAILDSLHHSGILTLDVPADQLTISVINTYLRLKAQGRL